MKRGLKGIKPEKPLPRYLEPGLNEKRIESEGVDEGGILGYKGLNEKRIESSVIYSREKPVLHCASMKRGLKGRYRSQILFFLICRLNEKRIESYIPFNVLEKKLFLASMKRGLKATWNNMLCLSATILPQ